MLLFWWFVMAIIFAILGGKLGKTRNIGGDMGAILGLVLGLIGIIIVLCSKEISDNVNTPQPFVADQLAKWYDLKEKGAITEDEFEKKKQEILNSTSAT